MQIDFELCIFLDIIETINNLKVANVIVTTILLKIAQYIWKY